MHIVAQKIMILDVTDEWLCTVHSDDDHALDGESLM